MLLVENPITISQERKVKNVWYNPVIGERVGGGGGGRGMMVSAAFVKIEI